MSDDVGTTPFPPQVATIAVTREAIMRFAAAAGISSPKHHDVLAAQRAGFTDLVAPPYFFTALGLTMGRVHTRAELSDGGLPIDDPLAARKIVAGETMVRWFGHIVAGDIITVTQVLLGVKRKTGRSGPLEIYTFRRDYARDGELVVQEHYSRIAR